MDGEREKNKHVYWGLTNVLFSLVDFVFLVNVILRK